MLFILIPEDYKKTTTGREEGQGEYSERVSRHTVTALYASLASLLPPSRPQHTMSPVAQPTTRDFNPYAENGGTILAIAGLDFAVVAGDTRQSEGYSIQTRYAPKVFRLCVLCLKQSQKSWVMACPR